MSSVPPPLTKTTAAGKPYVRRQDVTAEIAQLLVTGTSSWTPDGLASETLVHLIRVLWKRGDEENLLGRFVHRLGRHIGRIAKDVAKGFDPTTTDEIVLNVGKDVVTLVFAESATRQSEFLEVAFRVAVKRRTLNEVQKRKNHPRQRQLASADGETNPLKSKADNGPTPEEIVIAAEESELGPERIRKGLAAITDPRHREAVVLHYLRGWPITDKNPETPTLCKRFGKSARQIQNWMNDAFDEMRAALGVKI
jgi:DNA-directed RNA polymerase specialized sigma24 family protein